MQCCCLLRKEIPGGIVCRRSLWYLIIGTWLDRVDEIGKLDRVLDKENRDVVADNIEISLVRVAL
jgi:hypothetical protein